MKEPRNYSRRVTQGPEFKTWVPRFCVLSDCGLRGPSTNERLGNAHLSQGLGGVQGKKVGGVGCNCADLG